MLAFETAGDTDLRAGALTGYESLVQPLTAVKMKGFA
jgi:hypothetical protein